MDKVVYVYSATTTLAVEALPDNKVRVARTTCKPGGKYDEYKGKRVAGALLAAGDYELTTVDELAAFLGMSVKELEQHISA